MSKTSLILILLPLIFVGCSTEQQKDKYIEKSSKSDRSRVVGTWKMIYGEIRDKDTLEVKDLSETNFIKIINETHFAFFNQNLKDPSGFYGGGGTYKLEGNKYAETLTYTSVNEVRGHEFPFTIELKGDTLIQFGTEEVEEANLKRDIIEKYLRIK